MDILRESWDLISDQYWLFLGLSVVSVIVGGAVPLGILMGPMMCGVYACCLVKARGGRVEFAMVFGGFEVFVEALLASLAMMAAMMVAMVPLVLILLGGAVGGSLLGQQSEALGLGVVVGAFLAFTAAVMIVGGAVGVGLGFMYLLIVDRRAKAMAAIGLSLRAARANLGGLVTLHLCLMVLSFAGLCLCYFGAFLVMPLHFAAVTIAYRKVFAEAVPVGSSEQPQLFPGS